ncbi:down syndrome cell adhesion molecule-like protein Dscam2 [Caerostris extrusa]|uniref:Down syndrome cell adhesion molecule-like protein Dscam2 n=1 Tax=Caerostris extrusa TaxID=172846 RepID=A0AAV4M2M4_CAEEX|nr:down syndrome cell adhesion molecule-like protein Dscam2 [Caerostris extrusa]
MLALTVHNCTHEIFAYQTKCLLSRDLQWVSRVYELTETVLGSGTTSELTIRRADRRDSALYTCIASNSFGQDDTNMQLIMQEPPDAPQDVKVLEFGSRTAKLGMVCTI